MNQPRWQSAIESVANIAVGYGVALATHLAVFPLFGMQASLGDNTRRQILTQGMGGRHDQLRGASG